MITSLQVVIAAVYILVGLILGRLAHRSVLFIRDELKTVKASRKVTHFVEYRAAVFVKYAIYLVFLFLALGELGIVHLVIRVLLALVLLYVLVYAIISLKDYIVNMRYSFRFKRKNIKRGTKVDLDGLKGTVTRVSRTHVELKTRYDDVVHIPMSYLAGHPLKKS